MAEHMLTTTDNPFDPFTEWDEWFATDERLGYYTTAYLARVVVTSNDLSEADQSQAIEYAIDEIISQHPSGPYLKVAQS